MNQPINILIVDDEAKNLIVLETVLSDPGYRLVRAGSADQALLALVAEEFALLILDIRMPGMSGFELAQMIKDRKKTARVPIIFLTAYHNEDQHVLEGYEAGAVDYLHKPVNAAVLRSKVAVFAELHRKNREAVAANRALLAEVAERRRAEERLRELNETLEQRVEERTRALRESEHFLQRVTEVTPGVIHIFDVEERRSVFVNRSVAAVLGYSAAEVQAAGSGALPALMHPDDVPRFEEHLRVVGTLADGAVVDFEHRLRDRAGEWHWFHSRDAVFARNAAGGVRQIIGTSIEITQRKRAEEGVADLNRRLEHRVRELQTILEVSPVGIAVAGDPECRTVWANPALRALLRMPEGSDPSAGLGAGERPPFRVLRQGAEVPPQDLPMRRSVASGRPVIDEELHVVFADGTTRVLSESSVPLFDAAGTVRGCIGFHTDLTERKRVEAVLQDADRRKDEFLATLAHELRNPLAPMRNAAHVLHVKGPPTQEVRWARDVIDRQIRQMARLIDDLMDVCRINQGKLELKRERVEFAKVVQGAVEASRPLIDQMGHELAATLPTEPVVLEADLTRLAQVFLNLLNNAAKYTERGGRIDLRAERQGSDMVVSVRDTGIGIPADKLPTIFEMFSQVEGALSRSQGGLGIGLCLVRRLVELHGGSVEARSEGVGKGSVFTVRLPIVPDQAPLRGADPVDAMPTSALRILVADDNRDAATSLAVLLRMMGNSVHTVFDGEAAVAAAAEFQPDVVLCDIGMPKLNGYEACRQIRAQGFGRNVVLIAVTGWAQHEDRRKSQEAGFDHHMVKPVDPQTLMTMLSGLNGVRA
ncbi:hybrid sensor histidine kinase/response regulator [Gemmata sp.]|uniref:hybrid sensor histidine kinase/response regulator n=1 Tax=Gemmata sp. TaxID=1914242 RepID=UPI003F702B52